MTTERNETTNRTYAAAYAAAWEAFDCGLTQEGARAAATRFLAARGSTDPGGVIASRAALDAEARWTAASSATLSSQAALRAIVDTHDDLSLAMEGATDKEGWAKFTAADDVHNVAIDEAEALLTGSDPVARALLDIVLARARCEGSEMHDDDVAAAFDEVMEDGARVLGKVLS